MMKPINKIKFVQNKIESQIQINKPFLTDSSIITNKSGQFLTMSSSIQRSKSNTILIQNGSHQSSNINGKQQGNDNESQAQKKLERLKSYVQLTKQELVHLTNHNQFSQKVSSLNFEAKNFIQGNRIEQALVYLNEAQRILEYAASSGRNIERRSILLVLHNQACCYQVLWDLEKCSNYIQALIFNFNSELKFDHFQHQGNPKSETHSSRSKKSISTLVNVNKMEQLKIEKRTQLSKYYLLYCAINSQLKNNEGALNSARKASQITKGVFQSIFNVYKSQGYKNTQSIQNHSPFVSAILEQIPRLSPSIKSNNKDELLRLVRHYMKVYNSKCLFNKLSASKGLRSSNNYKDIHQKYKNFTIGNIMQLQPVGGLNVNDNNQVLGQKEDQRMDEQRLVQMLIVFSVCHFTMATQLRYIALNNANGDKQTSRLLEEFRQSQAYHLLSILLIAMYMPFELIYMQHIISSYHSHYSSLQLDTGLDGTPFKQLSEKQIQKIKENSIFVQKPNHSNESSRRKQQETKKQTTTNQSNSSIVASFHQQDDDSKQQQSANSNNTHTTNLQIKGIDQHQSIIIHQQLLSEAQQKLFDQYYYCKKNIESDQGLDSRRSKDQTRLKLKNIKSKSKNKKSNIKTNLKLSKPQTKSKSKSKQTNYLASKPIKTPSHTKSPKQSVYQIKSHFSPIMTPPILAPNLHTKINNNSKSKLSKSKQIKKIIGLDKNTQNQKGQSEYFNHCNFNKKVQNQLQKSKSPYQNVKQKSRNKQKSNKKILEMKKKCQDQIKSEYFHINNRNILKEKKSPATKKLNPTQKTKQSIQKQKKQRSSLRSLQKALSPQGLQKKSHLISHNSKLTSYVSKQKAEKLAQGDYEGRGSKTDQALYSMRPSMNQNKPQRNMIYNMGAQKQRKMKVVSWISSIFDQY